MGHRSTPHFRTFHALRIKGFASVETIAEIAGLEPGDVEATLADLAARQFAQFRENRGLWQLTPDGRAAHLVALGDDVGGADPAAMFAAVYPDFVEVNAAFKELCGSWQLRDGAPNDHSDAAYDAGVIDQLTALNGTARPLVAQLGVAIERMAPYGPRLELALARLRDGASNMFTGVMCNSYHDIWMELHEDLILTQGIDRTTEGSF